MLNSRILGFLIAFISITALQADEIGEEFGVCTTRLSQLAQQRGVSAHLADAIVAKLSHQSRVIELDRSQPEFVQTFTGYFTQRVTDWRVQRGRVLMQDHKVLLQQLQQKYGIPAPYLVSFWGLETNFGSYKGKMPVLDSLATLACDKRRSAYFTEEFLVA
jgi:membrane-bound lytic murein transglycosylase B